MVFVFGGLGINAVSRVEDFGFPYEFLIRSGRAVIIPAYWGTLERGPSKYPLPSNDERDRSLKWYWDLARSVDYLETRPDIDASKIGYYGLSWGAAVAPRLLALDERFRAAVFVSGGLMSFAPPDVDSWNFAPRFHVPALMINGKHDFVWPCETNQKLLFDALGTSPSEKKLIAIDGWHANPVTRPDLLREILAWFDRYLGPVREKSLP